MQKTKADYIEAYQKLEEVYQKRRDELNDIRRAVGMYTSVSHQELMERLRDLMKDEQAEKNALYERMGVDKGEESELRRVNAKLWFLLRTAMNDVTLLKELEAEPGKGIVTPFNNGGRI